LRKVGLGRIKRGSRATIGRSGIFLVLKVLNRDLGGVWEGKRGGIIRLYSSRTALCRRIQGSLSLRI